MARPKGSGPSPKRVARTPEVIRLYTDQRMGMKPIADRTGLAFGTVRNILLAAKVEIRPRGGYQLPR